MQEHAQAYIAIKTGLLGLDSLQHFSTPSIASWKPNDWQRPSSELHEYSYFEMTRVIKFGPVR